jgi:predicted DNA-binding transcriptional regulator YafY
VRDPAVRLLSLLSLLQSRPDWTGSELAARLGVSTRTVRNDISRLRELGYPVDAVQGPAGHYRLGVGAALPPLLLDDEEAVAVAVGLRSGAGVSGIRDSSARALAKLERVLPHRLRRSVEAMSATISHGPGNTGTDAADPEVDPALLSTLAAAIRDRISVRFDYHDPGREETRGEIGPPRQVEPYRLVNWQRRWYLVAREPRSGDWQVLRIDWIALRTPDGPRFSPTPPPDDYTDLVLREVASTGWNVRARIAVAAPAETVLARINPAVGVVETVDEHNSILVTGADSLATVAAYVGMLELEFRISEPRELVDHVRRVGERYLRATADAPDRPRARGVPGQ